MDFPPLKRGSWASAQGGAGVRRLTHTGDSVISGSRFDFFSRARSRALPRPPCHNYAPARFLAAAAIATTGPPRGAKAHDMGTCATARVRNGLAAGGRWIRTLGPPSEGQRFSRLLFPNMRAPPPPSKTLAAPYSSCFFQL